MAEPSKKKIRADFRKNRTRRPRRGDLTRQFQGNEAVEEDAAQSERVSGRGDLTRRRTVIGSVADADSGLSVVPDIDSTRVEEGEVVCAQGLNCRVRALDGTEVQCATSRRLKSLATDQRHVVVTGDRVKFRRSGSSEGMIERIEPRHGVLSRNSRGRQHVLVANVDQLLVVSSAAQPGVKPHLIDRILIAADHAGLEPIICINKVDLVDQADLQPLAGIYGQMGYRVLFTSATTGQGIEQVRQLLEHQHTAITGQSGVGKTSLLNAAQPGLGLRVRAVSLENEKGRHTTTNAILVPLEHGGWVVDTPGIRQFQLWDMSPAEFAGLFRDLRPYVSQCRFPNCTHTHEDECAVKSAVADHRLDLRRYESFCHLQSND